MTYGAKTWEKPHRDPSLDVVQSKPHSKVYPIGVTTCRTKDKEDKDTGRQATYTKEDHTNVLFPRPRYDLLDSLERRYTLPLCVPIALVNSGHQ
jgi:hypothetical protein